MRRRAARTSPRSGGASPVMARFYHVMEGFRTGAARAMIVSSYISDKAVKGEASQIQGRGLFAIAPISAGEIVAIKGGHIVDTATLHALAAGACWPASAGGTGRPPPARAARRDPRIGVRGLVADVLRRRLLRHEFRRVSGCALLAGDDPGLPDSAGCPAVGSRSIRR